jgi:hypothetical protein
VAIAVTEADSSVKLRVIDSRGSTVARGRNLSINRTLDAGIYFIQVSRRNSEGIRYRLNTSSTSSSGGTNGGGTGGGTTPGDAPNDPTDPGNLPGRALDLGRLDRSRTIPGQVGGSDLADFFRFTVDAPTQFTSSLGDFVNGSAQAKLYFDGNGNGLVDPGDELVSGADIVRSLGAGTYFIGVEPAAATVTRYTLRLTPTAITGLTPATDPFLGLVRATDLGTVTNSLDIKQLVGSTDSTDIYKFTLNSISNFTSLVNSSQRTGNITMALIYDQDNNGIADPGELVGGYVRGGDYIGGVTTSGGSGGSSLAITKTLGAGTYFLAVTQQELTDNTTYDLDLFVNSAVSSLTPAADPGPTLQTAANLGALSTQVNVKQFVGSVDGKDVYRFTLDRTRNIIVSYAGNAELVGLRLGTDLNNDGVLGLGEEKQDSNNGKLDDGEDLNGDGRLAREIFDPNLYSNPDKIFGDVSYAPLPPFFDSSASFDYVVNKFMTTAPTNIYAKLPAGTYYIEVDPQSRTTDLGDGLTRYGSANILYNLTLQVDG